MILILAKTKGSLHLCAEMNASFLEKSVKKCFFFTLKIDCSNSTHKNK